MPSWNRVLLSQFVFLFQWEKRIRSQEGNDPWNLLMLKDGRSWRGLLIFPKFQLIFQTPTFSAMYSSFQGTFESMIFLFWLGNVSSQDPQDLCILGFFVSHWNSPTSTEFSSLDVQTKIPMAFRLDKQFWMPLWMVDTAPCTQLRLLVFGNQIIT